MPRKKFASKDARRRACAALPAIPVAFLDDVEGVYEVVVSNGSGSKTLTMTGTQEALWGWAVEAGRRGGLGQGRWEPRDINLIRPLFESEPFAALV